MRKSKILSIRISEVTRQVKKMKNKDIFAAYESFDSMITQIIQMFENNDFCRKYRLHQNFIYMIFLDLVKIYNVFYIMTMETLDRYKRMGASEMNKALILYKNFCNFTDTLKKEANTIPMLFGFSFKEPSYYKPDSNKERAMKNALKDKEAGGDGFMDDDDELAEEVPDFEDQEKDGFAEEVKSEGDEDSDDDYQFDLLGDVKKQEQMASVHAGGSSRRKTMGTAPKKEKIKVDDFNTAALDDLLAGGQQKPARSGTMGAVNEDNEDEWDPFAKKEQNVYSTSQPQQVPGNQGSSNGASNNIFGDEDDIFSKPAQNQPTSKDEQKQALDDLLGGDDDYQNKGRSQTVAAPSSDYNMLKNLYNTATQQPQQNMGGMGQQQNYYNTGMPNNYGGGDMGGYNQGYNQGYGNQGYNQNMGYNQQPQNFNTGGGYGQGYGGGDMGYNNYGGNQYNTGMPGGGYNQNLGGGYGYGSQQNPSNFNTTAPGSQNNQNSDFDPFS